MPASSFLLTLLAAVILVLALALATTDVASSNNQLLAMDQVVPSTVQPARSGNASAIGSMSSNRSAHATAARAAALVGNAAIGPPISHPTSTLMPAANELVAQPSLPMASLELTGDAEMFAIVGMVDGHGLADGSDVIDNVTASNDTTDGDDEAEENLLLRPPPETLTHGFSIPTYLPPFPAFAMADLPSYTTSSTTTTTEPPTMLPYDIEELQNMVMSAQEGDGVAQDRLFLDAYNKQSATRRKLTLPATNITVQMGSHAYLPCRIRRLLNKPVSWVRIRDGHILSVDQTTFIADQRFQSIFKGETEYTWSLQIKYVQASDAGWYECQVSTEPKMSAKVYLAVVVPLTELIGDQNRFVKAGSKVALHCIVRGTIEPPTYIIWFHGKTQITDDNKMGWYTQIDRTIFGNSSDNENTIGSLIIPFVHKKDSGNYTCQPSNSAPVSVDLHVLSGEYSASAIMSAARTNELSATCLLALILTLALLWRT